MKSSRALGFRCYRLTILDDSLLGRGMLELRLLQRDGSGRVLRLLDGGAGGVVLLVADEQADGEALLVGGPGLISQLQTEECYDKTYELLHLIETAIQSWRAMNLPCTGAWSCCIGRAR